MTIYRLLGVAVGCIGMSVGDFCGLTPAEFTAVWEVWRERSDSEERGEWERIRMLATLGLTPWSRHRLEPAKVLPLPWDKERPKARKMSKAERLERIKELVGQIYQ